MSAAMRIFLFGALAAGFSGCAGSQSALDPAGIQASRIGNLWWLFFGVCAVVYGLVIVFVMLPLRGTRASESAMKTDAPILNPERHRQRKLVYAVSCSLAITTLLVFWLTLSDFFTQRALGALARETNALRIRITGQQWWWKVEYQHAVSSNIVTDANGFHIPVGRVVQLELVSSDVIHSFWVPNLHGKKDLVTGHLSKTWLRADRAGTFDGQCAEFCGMQHAKMRLVVVAEEPEKFEAWFRAQQQTAAVPTTEEQKRGYIVFMSRTCIMCHNISGTPASGQVGPDLSHVGSRPRIAGAYLANTRSNLVQWILNAQHIKAGSRMPQHSLSNDEVTAIATYLESLK
jgi:cytochrome c oxidase subunit II